MDTSNRNNFSFSNINAKIISLILCVYLVLTPTLVMASAASAFGGWSIGQVAASAGQATINATKNIGGQVVKSYAQVSPSAGALAKNIARVGGVMAVSVAIEALLGGVDWVLDPANNRVKYTEKVNINGLWCWNHTPQVGCGPTPQAAGASYIAHFQLNGAIVDKTTNITSTQSKVDIKLQNGGITTFYVLFAGTTTNQEKYLSYDAVGAEIAKNAAAGDPAANDFVADTANPNNWANENAYPIPVSPIVQQLDTNAGADAPPTTDNPPIDPNAPPTDPTKPFTLPGFCSWAAFICNAMNISNTNSQRAATASEQTRQNTNESNTKLTTIQGELVNGNNKTDELKGAVVNAGSAANAAATAQKDATKATTDAVTDLKGEVVNAGSAANAAATAQKDATKATTDAVTDLKGEVVNQGTKIGDIATGIKDLISTSIDRIVDAITAAKDAVKDAVDAGTAENTKIGDKAHDDAVAQKEATEDVKKEVKKINDEIAKDVPDIPSTPIDIPIPDQTIDVNISFGGNCPNPRTVPISMFGISTTMEFSFQPLCDIATFTKPALIAAASLSACFIIAGRQTDDE